MARPQNSWPLMKKSGIDLLDDDPADGDDRAGDHRAQAAAVVPRFQ